MGEHPSVSFPDDGNKYLPLKVDVCLAVDLLQLSSTFDGSLDAGRVQVRLRMG
ncbi:hypothetical protein N806_11105 [Rhodococcus sp. P27]|nr:hypothetical protein N806_11105 [Rhodococcus sp. P27]